MFDTTNDIIENHLRTGVGENEPIADVLQIVTPQYLSNLKADLIPTMLNETIVYITDFNYINKLIKQMSDIECQQFQVFQIHGIRPSVWAGLVLKKNTTLFKEINDIVTCRMTRATEK